jgi:hypothetical protein
MRGAFGGSGIFATAFISPKLSARRGAARLGAHCGETAGSYSFAGASDITERLALGVWTNFLAPMRARSPVVTLSIFAGMRLTMLSGGDQRRDLVFGHAGGTFEVPNPFYFIP